MLEESHVTHHAEKRVRERVGVNKKTVQKVSNRALKEGLAHCELTGKLKKFISELYLRNSTANNIKIYGEKVYIFRRNILITVVPLPHHLKKLANKLAKKE